MKIEITNGYVEIKNIYPRGIAREVNKILFKDVEMETDGDVDGRKVLNQKVTQKGMKMESTQEASDYAVFHMIEKIVIDEKEINKTQEYIDNSFDDSDFNKIKDAIDKLASPEDDPKV